jgi:integrase
VGATGDDRLSVAWPLLLSRGLRRGELCGLKWSAVDLGRPYYPGTISVALKAQAKAAGLPPIRLHDTRHTAASLMLADGVPTKVVTEILGHASPVITLSVYTHVLPGMAEEAGERLSAQLFG